MRVLSTSQNITLSSWPLITDIIKKQNLSIQERQAKTASFTPLLTDTEWDNAINGPYQEWLTMLVSAYFHYRYVLMALHLYQENPERDNPATQIPLTFLKKLSQEDPQIHQFKLDSLIKTQWAEWQTLFQDSAHSTLSQLQQISISIQDTHKQIFITDEPISDVLKDAQSQKNYATKRYIRLNELRQISHNQIHARDSPKHQPTTYRY